jgi:hypothetical protein
VKNLYLIVTLLFSDTPERLQAKSSKSNQAGAGFYGWLLLPSLISHQVVPKRGKVEVPGDRTGVGKPGLMGGSSKMNFDSLVIGDNT